MQRTAPVQTSRHEDPPEQSTAEQSFASRQSMTQTEPPAQLAAHEVAPVQSMSRQRDFGPHVILQAWSPQTIAPQVAPPPQFSLHPPRSQWQVAPLPQA